MAAFAVRLQIIFCPIVIRTGDTGTGEPLRTLPGYTECTVSYAAGISADTMSHQHAAKQNRKRGKITEVKSLENNAHINNKSYNMTLQLYLPVYLSIEKPFSRCSQSVNQVTSVKRPYNEWTEAFNNRLIFERIRR